MSIQKWLFWLYLLITPIIVAYTQASVLTFPTVDPFTGTSYNPVPGIFLMPFIMGVFILIAGTLITFTFNALRRKSLSRSLEIIVWIFLSSVFIIIFWCGLILSQRTVIFDYISTLHASRLHFPDIFFLPFTPQVFPKMGFSPYYTSIALGVAGFIGIVIYFYTLFKSGRNK